MNLYIFNIMFVFNKLYGVEGVLFVLFIKKL